MKMRLVAVALVWAGVVAGLGAGAATGQGAAGTAGPVAAKRPMTFADMMAMKRVSDPQISPSGKWVMFSVTEVSLEKNTKVNHLWVVPIAGGGAAEVQKQIPFGNDKQSSERQITFGDGESNGRFSPDGKWVSISMKDQIYLAPWDEAAGKVGEARELTNVAGGADGAVWSPDSKRLMFVAAVWPECSVKGGAATKTNTEILTGGQNDELENVVVGGTRDVAAWKSAEPAMWAEEDACDKAKDDAADKSPVKGQVWDGLLYRHWDHYTGAKRSHVLVVDADGAGSGKEVRDLTPASAVGDAETPTWFLGGPQEYAWAPDSNEIAYVTNLDPVPAASTNNDVFTLRLDQPGAKAVKVSTSPGSDDEPEYSPDGKWLAFRSQARAGFESDKFDLIMMNRETGKLTPLTSKFDGWVDEFVWYGLDRIYFTSSREGAEWVMARNLMGQDVETPRIISKEGEFSSLNVTADDSQVIAMQMLVQQPSEVVSIKTSNDEGVVHRLTHVNDGLMAKLDLAPLESFWFTGAEGTKVQGFIMRPPGFDAAKKYPVKFLMHGGPQTAWGDAWSFRWNWELMAASGYVMIGINRRGSTGYGQKFVDEVSGDWGGRAYEDLMKGLDYAEAKFPFLDKTRECALGGSYGGYMANWVLTHTSRFKCIVTHDGLYDPASAYGSTEEMWFNEWEFRRPEDFPKGWDGFTTKTNTEILTRGQNDGRGSDGHPAEPWRYQNLPADQDPFRKWSPMRFIKNAKTPTLVIHSQKDYRLDVSQGMELFTALQRLGVPSKFLYFPDEGHFVLKPQNSELWNAVVSDWCDRWTKSNAYAEK
jgi:dipeptidyl aminopeptidase/acylaminoacyl peptidase